jgi:hypothetical protein
VPTAGARTASPASPMTDSGSASLRIKAHVNDLFCSQPT